jgi:hypothetical protein
MNSNKFLESGGLKMAPLKMLLLSRWCLGGLLLAVFGTVLSTTSLAASVAAGTVANESQDAEIVQRARHRAYPGGRDESELAVQSQMTTPTRKITPQAEAPADPNDD